MQEITGKRAENYSLTKKKSPRKSLFCQRGAISFASKSYTRAASPSEPCTFRSLIISPKKLAKSWKTRNKMERRHIHSRPVPWLQKKMRQNGQRRSIIYYPKIRYRRRKQWLSPTIRKPQNSRTCCNQQ